MDISTNKKLEKYLKTLTKKEMISLTEKCLKTEMVSKRHESLYINLRKFHNNIKSMLIGNSVKMIKKFNKGPVKIFDISVGRMGDYHSWNRAGVDYVFGVDPDEKSILEAKSRLKNIKGTSKTKFNKTNVDLEIGTITDDVFDIKFPRNIKQFDIVSSQFALHYYFKTQKMFDNVLTRVVNSLKPGGFFIGTVISGDMIHSLLEKNPKIDNDYYSIEKKYTNYNAFGSKYEFSLHDKDDTGNYFENVSTEYLVSRNVLIGACKHFGLECKQIQCFEDWYHASRKKFDMTRYEKDVSFLYFSFVFQKPYKKKLLKNKKQK